MRESVRDRIKAIATAMLGNKPNPQQLREFEVALAGLLYSVNDEVRLSELEFRKAILAADSKTAAGKRQIAEAGPEFARLLEAKMNQDSVSQMLVTCRSSLRSLSDEMRMGSR